MNELIKEIIDTAPLYRKFLGQDLAICVSDMDKYIAVYNTKTLAFPFKEGDKIHGLGYDDKLEKISKTREPVSYIIPREVTGTVAARAILSPIIDGNKVVGYFSVTINIDKEDNIENISQNLTESIGGTKDSIHKIASAAEELSSMVHSIEETTKTTQDNIKKGNEAIQLIQGIAKQSNILGLNAAIEASRSGESGKGFSVVASQMRKLAVQSKDTANQVVTSLKEIEDSITSVLDDVIRVRDIANKQSESTSEISEAINTIADKSAKLVDYSKEQ